MKRAHLFAQPHWHWEHIFWHSVKQLNHGPMLLCWLFSSIRFGRVPSEGNRLCCSSRQRRSRLLYRTACRCLYRKGPVFWCGHSLIHVCSLELLAQLYIDKFMLEEPLYICPMIDARRMEVYTAPFSVRNEKDTGKTAFKEGPVSALCVQHGSFSELLNQGPVMFIGDGAPKCKELLVHRNARFANLESHANGMAKAALRAFRQNDFEDTAYYVPFYLKEYQVKQPKKTFNLFYGCINIAFSGYNIPFLLMIK